MLLTILGTTLALVICMVCYSIPWTCIFFIAPIALFIFVLAIIIGHCLAEPLRILVEEARAYKNGQNVDFQPDGRIREADELSGLIGSLIKTAESRKNEIAQREKLQSQFISDVAHELRTPLTAIRGNAEMLEDPDLPPELRDKFCDIIVSESARLTRLTNDLLTLQRIDDGDDPSKFQRINLRNLSQNVLDALQPIIDDCGAEAQVIGEAPDILGNPDRMKQALTNLIANATKFVEPGGHITVQLSGLHGSSVIQVKDDGAGFGDVDPKLLFGRFYRTDVSRARNTGGSGLGLAIVKSIVEGHDGTVEAVNLPEGGACFIVAIPSISE